MLVGRATLEACSSNLETLEPSQRSFIDTEGNQEKPVSRWPVAGPSGYWLLASSPVKASSWERVVSPHNCRRTSGERDGTRRAGVWVGLKVVLDAMEKCFLPLAGNKVRFLGLQPIAYSQYPLRCLVIDLDGRIILKWMVWIGFIWIILRVSSWLLGRR